MKATIDRSNCIGCGLCSEICSEVFSMADDGLAEVIANPITVNFDSAKKAAENCPVTIITIEE